MSITVDLWLYGALSQYAGESSRKSHGNLAVTLEPGSTVADLLDEVGLPTEERGITFINGQLSAMPGLQHDLDHELADGDRVAMFDLKSMWPFQYRHGARMTEDLSRALGDDKGAELHHTFRRD